VLRHFPNFRAAWTAAGIQLADARWAPWTAEQDRYVLTQLGVQPTTAIAEALGRCEAAVRARARKLGLRVGTARGWRPQRAATTDGVSEYVLRTYIRRGGLLAFGGAKHVYLDPADVVVVSEIDWQHPPAELEAAALRSPRRRLIVLLTRPKSASAAVDNAGRWLGAELGTGLPHLRVFALPRAARMALARQLDCRRLARRHPSGCLLELRSQQSSFTATKIITKSAWIDQHAPSPTGSA